MIYAYDKLSPLPIRDIYDTQMMLAAIGAAKDMYDQARQDMKDFKKEYGDFFSPIQKDMDWYKQNVTDPVYNTINELYAAGIDPLRSVEGRAAIRKIIDNIDVAGINFRKQRAENAQKYYASRDALKAKNMYNEDFAKSLGEDPQNWNDNYIGTTSTTPYMDYKVKYGHLFDKMGLEYDKEASEAFPGMLVMDKSKARMHDILSANRPDLINDPQYIYDLNRIKDSIKQQNPDMSEGEALSKATTILENEIVERNHEGGMQLIEDPVQKFQNQVKLQNLRYSQQRALRNSSTRTRNQKVNDVGSYNLSLLARGLANWSGSADPGVKGLEKAVNFGKEKANLPIHQMNDAFLNYYSMNDAETSSSWITRMSAQDNSRTKDAAPGGVLYIPTQDRSKLYTLGELTSNTLGNANQPYREHGPLATKKDNKQSDKDLSMVPTGKVYTAPMKNGSYEQFAEVRVGNDDGQKTYYYKIYQSEPVPIIPAKIDYSKGYRWFGEPNYENNGTLPPGGYNILPSESTLNSWLIPERALNHAIGLGSEAMKSGSTELLDYLDDLDDLE